tara:strand:+ start:5756 stop:7534 length:1779 start_codon:yes stop_codon:yes gene_type:complete
MINIINKLPKKKLSDLWISASKLRNYALDDPLLDYLKLYNIKDINTKPKKYIKKKYNYKKTIFKSKSKNNYKNYILNQGIVFEENIYKILKKKFKNNIVKICNSYEARDTKFVINTIDEMKKGTYIIYQGVLFNPNNKTFGCPDLIVRSDILNNIFDEKIIEDDESNIGAKNLNLTNYHYRIIDIKNSTLYLNSDNRTLRNTYNIKPYKCQINIYNQCIGYMQGYTPSEGYILGKSLVKEYYKKNTKYKDTYTSFQKLGIINYEDFDKHYNDICENGIKWYNKLLNNSSNWTLDPPSNHFLYPNMNNKYDYEFKNIKNQLANNLGEITSIWNCGVSHRENAFNNNIYSWKDEECNSKILGINGKKGIFLDKMLTFQRDNKDIINLNNISDNSIFTNKLLLYVDFETINMNSINLIFMIGLGYNENNKWKYINYTCDKLDDINEKNIIDKFLNDINIICMKNNDFEPLIIHWSNAERNIFNTFNKKYHFTYKEPKWFDLMKYFMNNEIFIKDSYSFSLKNIGKHMNNHKLIKTNYKNNEISNGLDAMFLSWQEYNKSKNKDIKRSKVIKDTIKYNEVDCKIMWDIVNYLNKTI